jgi:DNA-binding transcriptional MerR regulator
MASYRIKAVSHMTGIRPELVRMWERRYGLFKPQRAGNRYREFDDEDVQLLLYLRQQIEQGRAIGELAAEGRDTLLRRITSPSAAASESGPESPSLMDELLGYVLQFDQNRLEARLAELAAFASFATFTSTILTPLMHRLGDAWASGNAPVASGHFATAIFKQRLLTMLHTTSPASAAPVVVCACPAGEWHELGLLTLAYRMQQDGWQICYLGPNLPTQALLEGCERLQPALVALSLTGYAEAATCLEMLNEIDAQVAALYPTVAGGQAVEALRRDVHTRYLTLCNSLTAALQQGQHLRRSSAAAMRHLAPFCATKIPGHD